MMNNNKRDIEVGKFIGKMAAMPKYLTEDPYAYMMALGELLKEFYGDAWKIGYGTGCADSIISNSQKTDKNE